MHASGCSLIDLLIRELMHEETRYNNYGVRPQQASEDTINAPVVRLAHIHISAQRWLRCYICYRPEDRRREAPVTQQMRELMHEETRYNNDGIRPHGLSNGKQTRTTTASLG